MSLENYQDENATIFKISGAINQNNAMELQKALVDRVREGKAALVLDMQDVTYIDSMGVGALINAMSSARKAGGDLKLACVSRMQQEIMRYLSVHTIFNIHPSTEDARNAFLPL